MPTKVRWSPIVKEVIPVVKYRGIFDYESFFNVMDGWFKRQRFEVHEDKFKHGVPNEKGFKHEVTWIGKQQVNAYVEYEVKADFVFWDMKEVEAIRDGVKRKLISAKAKTTLSYKINDDHYKIFNKKNRFHAFLGRFFNKYVYKQDLGAVYEDQLYYWLFDLHKTVKDYFDMETKHNAY